MRLRSLDLIYLVIFLIISLDFIHGQTPPENSDNFIIMYFVENVEYGGVGFFSVEFVNSYRNEVSYLINGETRINKNNENKFGQFTVNAGTKLEIHFSSCIQSLEGFLADDNSDSNVFYNLISVDFSHFDSSCLTKTTKLFHNCQGLKSINFSNFNTEKVNDMSYMFSQCKSLKSIDLSNFNTSSVEKMDYMFYFCEELESLNLPNFVTSSVVSMDSMFEYCFKLVSLNLSNSNTSSVVSMNNTFPENLQVLDISGFDIEKIASEELQSFQRI